MRQENLRPAQHKVEAYRRIAHAGLGWDREYLLAELVDFYLKLDAREQKEYDDMLAQRDSEDLRPFETRRTRRMRLDAEREGMQQLLLRQLERRFGALPDPVRSRVEALESMDELTGLADGVLTADSLEDLGLV